MRLLRNVRVGDIKREDKKEVTTCEVDGKAMLYNLEHE